MKFIRNKDIGKIKISHNKKLFWIIIILIIALIVLVWSILQNAEKVDCVPAICCHPIECVSIEEAPDCSGVVCSAECKPGSLDCGQGSCEFVEGECVAVIK